MGSMDGDRASTDLVFVAEESPGGGLTASAVGHSIVTQAENEEELRLMGRDALRCHFEDDERPELIRLHFVRNDVIAAE